MADTDVKENGVYAWMASVRASMDDDSSRKIFENQVQSHAFSFLDNYLEHILAGPKQGPIIELVKTPRHKRNIPRKTRAAAVAAGAAKNTAPFSLDDDNSTNTAIPVNSFHKALLQAKERSLQDALDPQKPTAELPLISYGSAESKHGLPKPIQPADIPEGIGSIKPGPQIGATPLQYDPRHTSSEVPLPASEHGIHLSVIAENNESPDESHAISTASSTQDELPQSVPQLCQQMREHPATEGKLKTVQIDLKHQGNPSAPSPADAHCCVPFGSPREVQFSEAPTGSHTEPLPLRTVDNPNCEINAFTAPLPLVPVSNPILPPQTFSVPLNDLSPKALPHKNSVAGFPTLPAPSPLRKSTRFTQDAPTNTVHPTIAPAPMPFGKRTSWLMKAREAKAMEGTSSLHSTSMGVTSTKFPRVPTALKRKSGEMLGELSLGPDIDEDQRRSKVGKSEVVIGPPETGKAIQHDFLSVQGEPVGLEPMDHPESHMMNADKQTTLNSKDGGFIDLFKRTVEGLGARAAKSASKSLGGAVVAALAEARAAAEARVAERNKINTGSDSEALLDGGWPDEESIRTQAFDIKAHVSPSVQADRTDRRLSLSDLVSDTVQDDITESTKGGTQINSEDESVSTTPPDSPPLKGNAGFMKLTGPVFNKPPPPVFMPPASKQPTFDNPSGPFTLPAGSLDIHARLTAPSNIFTPPVQGISKASVQSSQCDTFSNPVVDKHDRTPPWAAPVQDSLYNIHSQQRDPQPVTGTVVDDDDDSWPLEEKLAAAESGWRPFDFSNVDKEDTWSSLPTESQGPTRSLTTVIRDETMPLSNDTDPEVDTKSERAEPEQQDVEISDPGRSASDSDSGKPDDLARAEATGLSSVGLKPITRAASHASMASTISSQSQVGFFSQATRLVNNMLSGGKKAKPELKSLQLAAVAAKKQQEEADKKTQRLKDMEARRQVAIAKKAEEERTRLLEEERRSKEDFERRKREREENTDRRPLKPPVSTKKSDDDASKKRKVIPESEKKPESKKLPTRDKKDLAPPAKLAVTPAMKSTTSKNTKGATTALISSAVYNAAQNPPSTKFNAPEAKPFKVVPSLKGKAKSRSQEEDIGDKLPSTMVQSQMAARAKAQMQTTKVATPEIPSESIELPEINSEYSDSEDEGRVRTFDPPGWAQSPELRQALQMQSTVNPDDIFGEIRPLRMEEMFRTRQSRFRARTSSANWSGTDRLTLEEIREYERRMGFQSGRDRHE